ncbi:hypothetical protein C1645_736863 [Glomus cerebriforme]|uniref:Uncharacterized protein n=1 Tax=Glomus cerebriforme TaxID=658196 RepID=A0A397T1Z4_9GLOM|nr:hypothetical protein C1645_736863 [Glomus cerebriforme]
MVLGFYFGYGNFFTKFLSDAWKSDKFAPGLKKLKHSALETETEINILTERFFFYKFTPRLGKLKCFAPRFEKLKHLVLETEMEINILTECFFSFVNSALETEMEIFSKNPESEKKHLALKTEMEINILTKHFFFCKFTPELRKLKQPNLQKEETFS